MQNVPFRFVLLGIMLQLSNKPNTFNLPMRKFLLLQKYSKMLLSSNQVLEAFSAILHTHAPRVVRGSSRLVPRYGTTGKNQGSWLRVMKQA